MASNDYKNLVEEVDKAIPFYTTHLERLRKMIDAKAKATEYFIQIDPKINLADFEEIDWMNKLHALLTISLLDLMVVCKNLFLAETDWERIYFIKQGYLIVYETIYTYHRHSLNLKKAIETNYVTLLTNFEAINEALRQFKKLHDYEDVIGLVRNKVAGHIDKDFVLYYDIVTKLDGEKVAFTISHFIQILTQLLELLKNLASHANSAIQNRNELLNIAITEKFKNIEDMFAKFEKSS